MNPLLWPQTWRSSVLCQINNVVTRAQPYALSYPATRFVLKVLGFPLFPLSNQSPTTATQGSIPALTPSSSSGDLKSSCHLISGKSWQWHCSSWWIFSNAALGSIGPNGMRPTPGGLLIRAYGKVFGLNMVFGMLRLPSLASTQVLWAEEIKSLILSWRSSFWYIQSGGESQSHSR